MMLFFFIFKNGTKETQNSVISLSGGFRR